MKPFTYRTGSGADRKPSIEVHLPLGFRMLEAPLNQLILRLDIAEERETRIEQKVDTLLRLFEEAEKAGEPAETPPKEG